MVVIRSSDRGVDTAAFGQSTDLPVPGHYAGDPRAQLAVVRAFTFRQAPARMQREQAVVVQVARRPTYDVLFGRAADQSPAGLRPPDETRFPRFAASFHKLLAQKQPTIYAKSLL